MRILNVQHLLEVEALLITDPRDLFYLTGLKLSDSLLAITQEDAYIIVDGRYFEETKGNFPFTTILKKQKSVLEENLPESLKAKKIGFDSSKTCYQTYLKYKKNLKGKLVSIDDPISTLRKIKDKEEIDYLQKAADLNQKGLNYAKSILRTGITEMEVAREIEIFWLQNGGEELAFETNISFGANSSMPHHKAGESVLLENQIVLMDVGVRKNNYCSDMTRTFFWGEPDKKMQEIHAIVSGAKKKALEICKAGITIGELDSAARDFIEESGYGEYFSHGLGHGVGLEVHESPRIRNIAPYKDELLEDGMVITIEPGIYLPGEGGVREEDTVLVTSTGYKNFYNENNNNSV